MADDDGCEGCKLLKAEIALQTAELEHLRAIVAATAKLPTNGTSASRRSVETQTEQSSAGVFSGDAAQMVAEVAEQVTSQTGFVFDPGSGYYYDSSSGLYYDVERQLYYDPLTMCFFRHNVETGENEIVSTVEYPPEGTSDKKKELANGTDGEADGEKEAADEESEDGEIKDRSSEPKLPPCVRLVVSSSSRLRKGSILMVTHPGGIIGSSNECDVIVQDDGVSAKHAEIWYHEEGSMYQIRPLGRASLVVSGNVLGPKSSYVTVGHWSSLQIGTTQLVCHVHEGLETCNACEPGLTMEPAAATYPATFMSKEDRERERKRGLKALKKKYGVAPVPTGGVAPALASGYQDRAEHRRVTKGVDDLYAKPAQSSVDQPIRADNVGRKLMEKMGWKEGSSLGAAGDSGIVAPIGVEGSREAGNRAGLGAFPHFIPPPPPAGPPPLKRDKKEPTPPSGHFMP